MKKQTYIILSAIILIILVVFFVKNEKNSTITKNIRYFAIRDTSLVTGFRIEGADTINIYRRENGWILNDSLAADWNAVNNFLFAFNRLKINGIIKNPELEKNEKVLTITINEDKKLRQIAYYQINNMDVLQRKGKDLFFLVDISGFPDNKLCDIVIDDSKYWRSRLLSSFYPEDILLIKLRYPSDPDKDFMIYNTLDSLVLINGESGTFFSSDLLNEEKLQLYFSYFANIYFEDFLRGKSAIDSLFNVVPDFQIDIEDKTGNILKLDIWPANKKEFLNENYAYLRINNDREILVCKYVLIDLWKKEKIDFLLN